MSNFVSGGNFSLCWNVIPIRTRKRDDPYTPVLTFLRAGRTGSAVKTVGARQHRFPQLAQIGGIGRAEGEMPQCSEPVFAIPGHQMPYAAGDRALLPFDAKGEGAPADRAGDIAAQGADAAADGAGIAAHHLVVADHQLHPRLQLVDPGAGKIGRRHLGHGIEADGERTLMLHGNLPLVWSFRASRQNIQPRQPSGFGGRRPSDPRCEVAWMARKLRSDSTEALVRGNRQSTNWVMRTRARLRTIVKMGNKSAAARVPIHKAGNKDAAPR